MNQTASPAALVADEPLSVPVDPSSAWPRRLPMFDVRWLTGLEEELLKYARASLGVPAAVFEGETGANYSGRAIALQQWMGPR